MFFYYLPQNLRIMRIMRIISTRVNISGSAGVVFASCAGIDIRPKKFSDRKIAINWFLLLQNFVSYSSSCQWPSFFAFFWRWLLLFLEFVRLFWLVILRSSARKAQE